MQKGFASPKFLTEAGFTPMVRLHSPQVLIVILVAVLGIGGYFWFNYSNKQTTTPYAQTIQTPAPTDETTNWKTYKNTKYGYSIKYLPDKFIDCSLGDIFALHYKLSNDTICASGEGIPNLSITVFDKNKEAAEARFPECYSKKQETVKVGTSMGTKYTNVRNENDSCNTTEIAYARSKSYILIDHEGTVLQVVLDEYSNQESKITQFVNQILSTFTFD